MLIKILESLKAKLQVALEPMTMQMYLGNQCYSMRHSRVATSKAMGTGWKFEQHNRQRRIYKRCISYLFITVRCTEM
jgi:hypothetical protein